MSTNFTLNTSLLNSTLDMLENSTRNLNMSNVTYYDYYGHMEDDILKTHFLPIIVCSGIIGIVLTVIVLSRKTMCTSTNCYLTSLAVADLLFLFILSVFILLEKLNSNEHIDYLVHHYMTILMNTFHLASVWVTVMLAVERYIAICHPLRAMAICTIRRARIVIVIIFILSFIVRIPNFFEYEFIILPNGWGIRSRADPYNVVVYVIITDGFLTAIIPFIALLGLNVRLIVEIRRSSRYLRYHLAADSSVQSVISSEQLKITLMLISIIIAFFLCQSPYVIYHAIVAFSGFQPNVAPWFNSLTKILVALKSSCNFVLYCWFSEKFWNTFKRIFCLRFCLPKQLPKGASANSHNNVHRPSYLVTRETTCTGILGSRALMCEDARSPPAPPILTHMEMFK